MRLFFCILMFLIGAIFPPRAFSSELPNAIMAEQPASLCADWEALYQRLANDGFDDPDVLLYFAALPEYEPLPMVIKIKELYTNAMARRAAPTKKKKLNPYRIYANFVTQDSLNKCKLYLVENKEAFASMEERYGVPKEAVVSLLYVETKLGTFLGKQNAFWALAAMAHSDSAEKLADKLEGMEISSLDDGWLDKHLQAKSLWAYEELKALLRYSIDNKLNPAEMPGSIYGAIGICQFMPSNLSAYGADGNDDGVINLFDPADAIHSAGRFLYKHGWKDKPNVEQQRQVLKRYNNLTSYANTILALGHSVSNDKVHLAPPDAPKPKAKKK